MSAWKAKSQHLILMALRPGPKHGYDIIKYINDRSRGHLSIGYGSLYPALHALEKDGFVEGEWEAIGERKDKKTYHLTKKGKKELETISTDYRTFINVFSLLLEGK